MKKVLVITIMLMSVRLLAQIPYDNLILYLPFNGNANDESGNGHNGIVNNALLCTDRFGIATSAYFFDGIDDNIEIANIGDTIPTEEITISIWVKSYTSKAQFQLMLVPDDNRCAISINYFHDGMNTIFWDYGWPGYSGDSPGRLYNRPVPFDTLWHNYTFISSISKNIMMIYKDGTLLISKNQPLKLLNCSGKTLKIGSGNNGYYFNGLIDDLRIYNRVLDSVDMKYLFYESPCINKVTIYDKKTVIDTVINTVINTVTDTLIIDLAFTSINSTDNFNTIKIYPNPTNDMIYFDNGNFSSMNNYKVKIINSRSQVIFESNIDKQNFQIDISKFGSAGLFFVQIFNDNLELIDTKKIVLK
jgi:hypothetical protein